MKPLKKKALCYTVAAGLTMALTMGEREMELLAEKVLQKLEWYQQIDELAQAILKQLSEEDKEWLKKLAESRSDNTSSTETAAAADGGMETAPEAPPETPEE